MADMTKRSGIEHDLPLGGSLVWTRHDTYSSHHWHSFWAHGTIRIDQPSKRKPSFTLTVTDVRVPYDNQTKSREVASLQDGMDKAEAFVFAMKNLKEEGRHAP